MVGGGGTSRKGEFGQCGGSRNKNIVGCEACPDGIERLEPVEEVGILRGGDGARQGLVEVMMGVDQSRQEDVPAQVEYFVGGIGQTGSLTCLLDDPVPNKKTTLGNLPLVVIHRNDMGVFYQKCVHLDNIYLLV
jgi:hypothetical protein